jgi:Zn-finger protein
MAICKVRKPPSSEKIGKTGKGKATEVIFKESDTLFCSVPTWTLSTKRTADWDTNEKAIMYKCSIKRRLNVEEEVRQKVRGVKKKKIVKMQNV